MKLREKQVGPRPLSKGSVAWCEWMLGVAETGLCATEHDVRPLVEAVTQLKEHRAWEKLGTDEPKSWERLVCERLDTLYRRTAWIDALVSGYEALRKRGFRGRVTRKMAEQAVGFPAPGTPIVRVDVPQTVRPERRSPSGYAPGALPNSDQTAALHVSEMMAVFSSAPAAAQIAFLAQLQSAVAPPAAVNNTTVPVPQTVMSTEIRVEVS